MLPCKSESFTFHRNNSPNSSGCSERGTNMQQCRRKLQDKFDETDKKNGSKTQTADRNVLSVLSLNNSTRRALRNGAERITKTFNTVRISFGTFSQKFKTSTRRRQILEEGPVTPNCATPHTFSKQILGRTPTKLYSPFGIDTPYKNTLTYDKENLPPEFNKQALKFTNTFCK